MARPGDVVRRVWTALSEVMDPELPFVSVVDLGMVRHVAALPGGGIEVAITPSFSACPAQETLERDVQDRLDALGLAEANLRVVLSPPWTTAWITASGRAALQQHGIAPPSDPAKASLVPVRCPRCDSEDTELLSAFGSTPCKALRRCRQCFEPFEQFKCI